MNLTAKFTMKNLRCRLAHQASLSQCDPFLPAVDPSAAVEDDQDSDGEAPESDPSQRGCTSVPSFPEEEVLEVDYPNIDNVSLFLSEDKD